MTQAKKQRLLWKSRRGMKELDLILGRFIETELEALSGDEVHALEALLSIEDPTLYQWLLGSGCCEEPTHQAMVEKIRES